MIAPTRSTYATGHIFLKCMTDCPKSMMIKELEQIVQISTVIQDIIDQGTPRDDSVN